MDYQTFEPPDDLTDFIRCFWTLEAPADPGAPRQRIVPDGCMEMIFHHGDAYRQYLPDGSSLIQPRCFVFGQVTRPLEIEPTGRTGIFAVRFEPNGFLALTPEPLSRLADTATPLEDLFGAAGKDLEDTVLAHASTTERMDDVITFLRPILTHVATADRLLARAVRTLSETEGAVSVDELAREVQVNRRRLERRFSSGVGVAPKYLARIVRLQAAVSRLAAGEYDRLTDLAHDAGYFDQAHFIREFREFTGQTPSAFYSGNLALSGLFSGAGAQ